LLIAYCLLLRPIWDLGRMGRMGRVVLGRIWGYGVGMGPRMGLAWGRMGSHGVAWGRYWHGAAWGRMGLAWGHMGPHGAHGAAWG
jgi:hypothetical protein